MTAAWPWIAAALYALGATRAFLECIAPPRPQPVFPSAIAAALWPITTAYFVLSGAAFDAADEGDGGETPRG